MGLVQGVPTRRDIPARGARQFAFRRPRPGRRRLARILRRPSAGELVDVASTPASVFDSPRHLPLGIEPAQRAPHGLWAPIDLRGDCVDADECLPITVRVEQELLPDVCCRCVEPEIVGMRRTQVLHKLRSREPAFGALTYCRAHVRPRSRATASGVTLAALGAVRLATSRSAEARSYSPASTASLIARRSASSLVPGISDLRSTASCGPAGREASLGAVCTDSRAFS